MPAVPSITFRNMPHEEALTELVQERAERLERFFDGVSKCEVVISHPHAGHHQKGSNVHVRIELSVPGDNIIVDRAPQGADRGDALVAIRDAFETAGRQLRQFSERLRDRNRDSHPTLRS